MCNHPSPPQRLFFIFLQSTHGIELNHAVDPAKTGDIYSLRTKVAYRAVLGTTPHLKPFCRIAIATIVVGGADGLTSPSSPSTITAFGP